MREFKYRDTWGGKNYGCYPINTPGKNIKDKLDKSEIWLLQSKKARIDERNDNQTDIHRDSELLYFNTNAIYKVAIYMSRSRSGKTVDWSFLCNFDSPIIF